MVTHAYLEEQGQGRQEPELALLAETLPRRGIPVTLFTAKQLARRQLALTPESLVAGSIDSVRSALKQLKIPLPEPHDYPDCLRPYLHRRVWTSTLGAELDRAADGAAPRFLKPAGHTKRFTGFVLESTADFWQAVGVSRSLPVCCSEVVAWRSEWRVFVLDGMVLDIRHYAGDSTALPERSVMEQAIATLTASKTHVRAYAIDFGVLATGQTALVEVNDGFSLGSYGLAPALYTDLTIARWEELLEASEA